METNLLATAVALSDQDLLTRIESLARRERESMAELVAHLTALELRPSLYLGEGYGSLFDYCMRALGLSEDAACSRINVVRAAIRFPVILDHLFAGTLTLTSARLLGPHLTAENHEAVLARARNQRRGDIEALIAELAPRPDVSSSMRKLPVPKADRSPLPMDRGPGPDPTAPAAAVLVPAHMPTTAQDDSRLLLQYPRPRSIVEALAPQRYRVQFTIGEETHDDLRTVQTLLRREIPNGDPSAIFQRALALLRKELERAKLGVVARPRRSGDARPRTATYENRIRFRTDTPETRPAASRHIPNAVKRIVWYRDRGQCAFVSANGRRCAERGFLELHHIQPYALEGPATAGNIALRCRRHNAYEAELAFGARAAPARD